MLPRCTRDGYVVKVNTLLSSSLVLDKSSLKD